MENLPLKPKKPNNVCSQLPVRSKVPSECDWSAERLRITLDFNFVAAFESTSGDAEFIIVN